MSAAASRRVPGSRGLRTVPMVLLVHFLLAVPVHTLAENLTLSAQPSNEAQPLKVVIGKSVIIDSPMVIKRASLANPGIADAIVLSPKQIYVAGKAFGTTNLTLWGKDEQVFTIFDLEVQLDLSRLKDDLRLLFPDEANIHAAAVHDHITLWGTISTSERRDQAFAVAEAYAPKKVVNFLQFDAPKPVADPAPKLAEELAPRPLPIMVMPPAQQPVVELATMPAAERAPKPEAEKAPEKPQSVIIEVIRGTSVTHVTTK